MEVQHGDLEWMFSMGTLAWGCQVLRWKSAPNALAYFKLQTAFRTHKTHADTLKCMGTRRRLSRPAKRSCCHYGCRQMPMKTKTNGAH